MFIETNHVDVRSITNDVSLAGPISLGPVIEWEN